MSKAKELILNPDFIPAELRYSYNTKGYMLSYMGKPIGGAGIDKYAKGSRANLKLFRECAEHDKQRIIRGCGQERYVDAILGIICESTPAVASAN